jgi:methyl-accepting chemotaxis protein
MSDEVELPTNDDSDEYEIIPMGPIRKLEKRIDELEGQQAGKGPEGDFVRDILDIMKANQKIVNDMVESTDQLHNSVEDLTAKMDDVLDNMNEFMDLLHEASETSLEEDVSGDLSQNVVEPIAQRMQDLHETNEKMLEGLGKIDKSLNKLDKRMKRIYASSRGGSRSGGNQNRFNRSGNQNQNQNRRER